MRYSLAGVSRVTLVDETNMAASSSIEDWRNLLKKHPLFELIASENTESRNDNDSKDILTVKDGEIFIWNAEDSNILTTNLKNLALNNDRASAYQTLLCTNPPVFDVQKIEFSLTGHHLALIGERGVTVVQMPRRWGKHADFEGGKEKVNSRTVNVGERFFASSGNIKLLQAAWHPGSETDTHLVLLTSDDCLRIFNIAEPSEAEQTFVLSDYYDHSLACGKASIIAALGELVVAFDFGPAVELKSKGTKEQKEIAWPVYLLRGNGEVYAVLTSAGLKRLKSKVVGPLTMHPPAEDNYGTDACSLLCIHSTPPVLVIATSDGNLYHCVVLNKGEDDDSLSEVSWTGTEASTQYDTLSETSLYVYERVELELSLTTVAVETDELIEDDFTCPIRLHTDPSTKDRYHCSHSAGVHAVVLPWLNRLEDFTESSSESLLEVGHQEAVVEHIICTKPLPSSPACPVMGLDTVDNHLLGTTLIILTAAMECLTVPLVTSYRSSPPPLLSSLASEKIPSPLRRLQREPFDQYIRKILRRESSNPLLRSAGRTDLTQQQCFQLLSRATQVFREEYIQKQDLAREEIEKRAHVLKDQKQHQQKDLDHCRMLQTQLTENARESAERYEDCVEKQSEILSRIQNILRKLEERSPVLSDAEKNMQKELKAMSEKITYFKKSLDLVKVKMNYQKQQKSRQTRTSRPMISGSQSKQLKSVLKDQGDQITQLVKEVGELKTKLDI